MNEQERMRSHKHPLLQKYEVNENGFEYCPIWNLAELRYLADYRIFDQLMCAGSNYIEIGLAIGSDLLPQKNFSIKNLFINKPLILDPNKPYDIKIQKTKARSEGYAYNINYARETYSGAEIYPFISAESVTTTWDDPILFSNKIDVNDFYEGLNRIGLSYGSSFRRLRNIQLNDEIACADLIPYEGEQEFICHPTSIYSAFQLFTILLAQLSEHSDTILLPSFLEEIRYFQAKSLCSRIFISRMEPNCFHLTLFDGENNILVDMPRFLVKSVSKKLLYHHIENQNASDLSTLHRNLRDYFLDVLKPTPGSSSELFLPLCQLIVIWATRLVQLFDSDEL